MMRNNSAPHPPTSLRDALLACADGDRTAVEAAGEMIRSVGTDAVDRAVCAVEPGIEDLRRWRIVSGLIVGATWLVLSMLMLWIAYGLKLLEVNLFDWNTWGDAMFVVLASLLLPALFSVFIVSALLEDVPSNRLARAEATYERRLRQGSLFALAGAATPESIGPLLRALQGMVGVSDEAMNTARRGLIAALCNLTREDNLVLTSEEYLAMRAMLVRYTEFIIPDPEKERENTYKPDVDVPMAIALIRAYTVLGDEQAACRIGLLATAGKPTDLHVRVINAAKKALNEVEERAEWDREQMENTLLRPANVTDDMLLRPVLFSEPAPEEQLLRPAPDPNDHDAS